MIIDTWFTHTRNIYNRENAALRACRFYGTSSVK